MRTRLPVAAVAAIALALAACSDTPSGQPEAAPAPTESTADEHDGHDHAADDQLDDEPESDFDPSDIDPADEAAYDEASAALADAVAAAELAAVLDVDVETADSVIPDLADTGAADTGAFVAYSFGDDITLVVTVFGADQFIDGDDVRDELFGAGAWQQVDVEGASAAYRYDLDIPGLTMKVGDQGAQLDLDGGPADALPALAEVVAAGLAG